MAIKDILASFTGLGRHARREVYHSTTFVVDILRAGSDIEVPIMFSDFRETFPLEAKKAVKVMAFLGFMASFYGHMSPQENKRNRLPLNTVLDDAMQSWYARLEQNCVVAPPLNQHFDTNAEYARHPRLADFIIEDLNIILGKENTPEALINSVEELETIGWGTRRIMSYDQYEHVASIAQQTIWLCFDLLSETSMEIRKAIHHSWLVILPDQLADKVASQIHSSRRNMPRAGEFIYVR